MYFVLLGPPGAGKGTQAARIEAKYQIPHIATGDIFRREIKNETALGKKAKSYIDQGDLVPDEVTIGMVKKRLNESDCKDGFILDGFPRTINQADALTKIMSELNISLDAVLNIKVAKTEVIKRLSQRRICSECGATYHLEFDPPAKEEICDKCSGELYQRDDDQAETIKERLKVYQEKTAPLIDYYQKKEILKLVDGEQDFDKVFAQIKEIIEAIR